MFLLELGAGPFKCAALLCSYTMNIDRLHKLVGLDIWSETDTDGSTVEMHGNIFEAVCEAEDEDGPHIYDLVGDIERDFMAGQTPICRECSSRLRPRVMMYAAELWLAKQERPGMD